jgi:hypothetical protein
MIDGEISSQGKVSGIYDGNLVEIYWSAVEHKFKSEQEGRPIFEKVPFVRIVSPGGQDIRRKLDAELRGRYPQLVKSFDSGESAEMLGTPLSAWPALSVDVIATLRAAQVHSVEQLADLPDSKLQILGMGARDWRAKAKAFIEAAAGVADVTRYAKENEDMKRRITELEDMVSKLGAALEAKKKPEVKAA